MKRSLDFLLAFRSNLGRTLTTNRQEIGKFVSEATVAFKRAPAAFEAGLVQAWKIGTAQGQRFARSAGAALGQIGGRGSRPPPNAPPVAPPPPPLRPSGSSLKHQFLSEAGSALSIYAIQAAFRKMADIGIQAQVSLFRLRGTASEAFATQRDYVELLSTATAKLGHEYRSSVDTVSLLSKKQIIGDRALQRYTETAVKFARITGRPAENFAQLEVKVNRISEGRIKIENFASSMLHVHQNTRATLDDLDSIIDRVDSSRYLLPRVVRDMLPNDAIVLQGVMKNMGLAADSLFDAYTEAQRFDSARGGLIRGMSQLGGLDMTRGTATLNQFAESIARVLNRYPVEEVRRFSTMFSEAFGGIDPQTLIALREKGLQPFLADLRAANRAANDATLLDNRWRTALGNLDTQLDLFQQKLRDTTREGVIPFIDLLSHPDSRGQPRGLMIWANLGLDKFHDWFTRQTPIVKGAMTTLGFTAGGALLSGILKVGWQAITGRLFKDTLKVLTGSGSKILGSEMIGWLGKLGGAYAVATLGTKAFTFGLESLRDHIDELNHPRLYRFVDGLSNAFGIVADTLSGDVDRVEKKFRSFVDRAKRGDFALYDVQAARKALGIDNYFDAAADAEMNRTRTGAQNAVKELFAKQSDAAKRTQWVYNETRRGRTRTERWDDYYPLFKGMAEGELRMAGKDVTPAAVMDQMRKDFEKDSDEVTRLRRRFTEIGEGPPSYEELKGLADGAIAKRRPGGTPVRVGESGDEAIMPLDKLMMALSQSGRSSASTITEAITEVGRRVVQALMEQQRELLRRNKQIDLDEDRVLRGAI